MQNITLKIKGLYSHGNQLSEAPLGSLSVADDIVIDRESIAMPRRGFDRLTSGFSNSSYRANKLFFYQDQILAHYSSSSLAYYDAGWTNNSTSVSPPDASTPVRAVEANQNFYFTTSAGVKKLDAYNAAPTTAGAYPGLDAQAAANLTALGSAWLADDHGVAYRVVWGYRDANNNLILGAPSQRATVVNRTGAATDVNVTFTIPSGVTTSWFYQVYRSETVDNSSLDTEPSDELGLVYEDNPTAGEITANEVEILDIVPAELRGATIYTAATQEGLVNSNYQPPLAQDLALYKGSMIYGNTISKYRLYLNLLAAGGATGLAVNDTITIDGVEYTAAETESVADAEFRVFTAGSDDFATTDVDTSNNRITTGDLPLQVGDPVTFTSSGTLPAGLNDTDIFYVLQDLTSAYTFSATKGGAVVDITTQGSGTHTLHYGGSASQNIRQTAESLVKVINKHADSTVYAQYISLPDGLPGKMILEERVIGGAAFSISVSDSDPWDFASATATNDAFKNGLAWSKTNQPESVPLGNTVRVGSADGEIKRLIALRDSVFIFKEDGIYRLSGSDTSSFRVDLFDASTRILAPESAVVLNNQIYAFTDQGVVSVSEAGVRVRSRPIEYTLLNLLGTDLSDLKTKTFAVAYETERKYILFVIEDANDTYPTQAFVFNTFTNTWVRWVLNKSCGGVNPADDKLYLGNGADEFVSIERKSYTFTDYVDYGQTVTISAVSGTTITVSNADVMNVGDVLHQSASIYSTIASIDANAGTVEVDVAAGFTVASATLLTAIPTRIGWVPFTGGNPGINKQFREVALLFRKDFTGTGTVLFTSDNSPSEEAETVTGSANGPWGLFGWGGSPWGGVKNRKPFRVYVPRNKQRASQLTVDFAHSYGYADFEMNGISVVGNNMSERVGDGSSSEVA